MARIILKTGKPITIETNGGTYTIHNTGKIEQHPTREELDKLYNDKRFPKSVTRTIDPQKLSRSAQDAIDREAFEVWLAEQRSVE